MSITTCVPVDGAISTLGTCFWYNAFGGDTVVIGVILLLAFAAIMWKSNIPISIAFPIGWMLIGGMVSAGLGGAVMLSLWYLGMVAMGYIIAKGVWSYAKDR